MFDRIPISKNNMLKSQITGEECVIDIVFLLQFAAKTVR